MSIEPVAYTIIASQRIIRVHHANLGDPRWRHIAAPESEEGCRVVERAIKLSTGLRRIHRNNHEHHVDYRIRADLFSPAACAVRLMVPRDECSATIMTT